MKKLLNDLKERFKTWHLVIILDGICLILHYIDKGGIGILITGLTMLMVAITEWLNPDTITKSDLYKAWAQGFVEGCKATFKRNKESELHDKKIMAAINRLEQDKYEN